MTRAFCTGELTGPRLDRGKNARKPETRGQPEETEKRLDNPTPDDTGRHRKNARKPAETEKRGSNGIPSGHDSDTTTFRAEPSRDKPSGGRCRGLQNGAETRQMEQRQKCKIIEERFYYLFIMKL